MSPSFHGKQTVERKSFMAASVLSQKRKALFLTIFFVALFSFTINIIDLSDELHINSYYACPAESSDSNIINCILNETSFKPEPLLRTGFLSPVKSIPISFFHLLPCGFRAPPVQF